MTLDDRLALAVDRAARRLGMTRSDFARMALRRATKCVREGIRENRHRAGYKRAPVRRREFDGWEVHQVWPT